MSTDIIVTPNSENNGERRNLQEYFLDFALDYASRGWHVVDLHHKAKNPVGDGWPVRATTREESVRQKFAQKPTRNVGILLGPRSKLIDIEADSPEAEETYKRLLGNILAPTYSAARGPHRFFAFDERLKGIGIVKIDGLEFRVGDEEKGFQSAVPPSVTYNADGKLVERIWVDGLSPHDLAPPPLPEHVITLILENAAKQPRRERKQYAGDGEFADDPNTIWGDFNIRADWESILEPHGWIHLHNRGDVEDWQRPGKSKYDRLGSATIGHCGNRLYVFSESAAPFTNGNAYSKFDAYCLLNHNGDKHLAASALEDEGFGAKGRETARLQEFEAGDWIGKVTLPNTLKHDEPPAVEVIDEPHEPHEPPAVEVIDEPHEPAAVVIDEAKRFFTLDDLRKKRSAEPPAWLVENHLIEGGTGWLFGESGAGKTFIAVEMACCIAHHLPFLGAFPTLGGSVIYIGQEGSEDFDLRLEAWHNKHGLDSSPNLVYVPEDFNITTPTGRLELLEVIAEYCKTMREPLRAVFFDTFFNQLFGEDENSGEIMGRALRTFKEIQRLTKAAIIPIHHPGHKEKHRPRGHSSLVPSANAFWLVEGNIDGRQIITATKQKNGKKYAPYMVEYDLQTPTGVVYDGSMTTMPTAKSVPLKFGERFDSLKVNVQEVLITIAEEWGEHEFSRKDAQEAFPEISVDTLKRSIGVLIGKQFIKHNGLKSNQVRYKISESDLGQILMIS
jgi:hypothetical protein